MELVHQGLPSLVGFSRTLGVRLDPITEKLGCDRGQQHPIAVMAGRQPEARDRTGP